MDTTINNTLNFTIPEGMHLMTDEELKQFLAGHTGRDNRIEKQNNLCMISEENHTYFNISWKKRPLILGRLASLEVQRNSTEKSFAKMVSDYESLGHGETTVDGVKMYTYRSRYTNRGIPQYGSYALFIKGNYYYAIQLTCRDGYLDFAEENLKKLMQSIRFH